MFKKFLGLTLAAFLCIPSCSTFASNSVSSDSKILATFTQTSSSTSDLDTTSKNLLHSNKSITKNNSADLSEGEKIVDSNIKKGESIKNNVNKTLSNSLQKSANQRTKTNIASLYSQEKITTSSAVTSTSKPIAQLRYSILNPSSLKNGQITTDTQIAWLWSYNGQNYTYDPNGYAITNVNIDGTLGVSDSIIGTLTGNIGFATQFKTPGEYILKFKCKNDHNVWSDEWNITIPVESTDNNTRPSCVINYSASSGDTNTEFSFSWAGSKDSDAGDSLKDVQGFVTVDGKLCPLSDYVYTKGENWCKVKFKNPGTYPVMFRVNDSHGAWSNWVGLNLTVAASTYVTPAPNTPTPNNISIDEVWSKLKYNPRNNTPYTQPNLAAVYTEAYTRCAPIDSEYLTSCVDNLGYTHNYYLLKLNHIDSTSYDSNPSYLIYDDNFLTSNEYLNGHYGTWFPGKSMTFKDGVMSANLGYVVNNDSDTEVFKRLHIFDYYTGTDYTIPYNMAIDKVPYSIRLDMTDNTKIVFEDGSGCHSIDRQTGKIS